MNTTTTKIDGEAMTDQNIERLEALAKHFEAGGSTLIGEGMSARYAEAIRALLAREVPSNVMAALDRMCTPLDESILKGATAEADAHSMKLIRDYVLSTAPAKSCGDAEQAAYSAPFTTDVPHCCGDPDTCNDPCHPDAAEQADEAVTDAFTRLVAFHTEQLDSNAYCYFELAYTRSTAWMAWITDRPAQGEPGTAAYAKSRKVIVRGQGDTPTEACQDALNALNAARAKDSK